MEPFGIATSILQVADTGFSLAKNLYGYTQDVKNAPSDVRNIAKEIDITSSVLQNFGNVLKDQHASDLCSPQLRVDALRTLEECRVAFADLNKTLVPFCRSGGGIKTARARFRWPAGKGKTKAHQERLERLKSSLSLMLEIIRFAKDAKLDAPAPHAVLHNERYQIEGLIRANEALVRSITSRNMVDPDPIASRSELSTASQNHDANSEMQMPGIRTKMIDSQALPVLSVAGDPILRQLQICANAAGRLMESLNKAYGEQFNSGIILEPDVEEYFQQLCRDMSGLGVLFRDMPFFLSWTQQQLPQRPITPPRPSEQPFQRPPPLQSNSFPPYAKTQSMSTPIDDSRSMLAQHWGSTSHDETPGPETACACIDLPRAVVAEKPSDTFCPPIPLPPFSNSFAPTSTGTDSFPAPPSPYDAQENVASPKRHPSISADGQSGAVIPTAPTHSPVRLGPDVPLNLEGLQLLEEVQRGPTFQAKRAHSSILASQTLESPSNGDEPNLVLRRRFDRASGTPFSIITGTETQAYEDELSEYPALPTPTSGRNQMPYYCLPPNRHSVAERYETASVARLASPIFTVARERSPFRDGSPLVPSHDCYRTGNEPSSTTESRQQRREETELELNESTSGFEDLRPSRKRKRIGNVPVSKRRRGNSEDRLPCVQDGKGEEESRESVQSIDAPKSLEILLSRWTNLSSKVLHQIEYTGED